MQTPNKVHINTRSGAENTAEKRTNNITHYTYRHINQHYCTQKLKRLQPIFYVPGTGLPRQNTAGITLPACPHTGDNFTLRVGL